MKAPSEEEHPGPNPRLEHSHRSPLKSIIIQTSDGPAYNITFIRITSTLKEVEEQMSSFNINISGERSGHIFHNIVCRHSNKSTIKQNLLNSYISFITE